RRASARESRARHHDRHHHAQRADRSDGRTRDHAGRRPHRACRGSRGPQASRGAALVSALGKKLRRDLWRLKGQVTTIALVLACGITTMIMLRSAWQSLNVARDTYYDLYRVAVGLEWLGSAPESLCKEPHSAQGVEYSHLE